MRYGMTLQIVVWPCDPHNWIDGNEMMAADAIQWDSTGGWHGTRNEEWRRRRTMEWNAVNHLPGGTRAAALQWRNRAEECAILHKLYVVSLCRADFVGPWTRFKMMERAALKLAFHRDERSRHIDRASIIFYFLTRPIMYRWAAEGAWINGPIEMSAPTAKTKANKEKQKMSACAPVATHSNAFESRGRHCGRISDRHWYKATHRSGRIRWMEWTP